VKTLLWRSAVTLIADTSEETENALFDAVPGDRHRVSLLSVAPDMIVAGAFMGARLLRAGNKVPGRGEGESVSFVHAWGCQ
jgi:hypothetical protein